jgi:hypothetical protein
MNIFIVLVAVFGLAIAQVLPDPPKFEHRVIDCTLPGIECRDS